MSDLQTIADRVEIEALGGEFVDALMMRDYDRLTSLFTEDGAWRKELNYALYHDRYRRTRGWKFAERVYDVMYLDTAPLAGAAPREAGRAG